MSLPIREQATEVDALFWWVFVVAIEKLYDAVLCGNPTEHQKKIREFMTAEPQMGDLVMEMSTVRRPHHHENRFGRLLGRVRETCPDLAPGELDELIQRGEEPPLEDVWYIVTPDAREVRWHNARFVRVPERFGDVETVFGVAGRTRPTPHGRTGEERE